MSEIVEALRTGKIDVLLLPGFNMLSSYPDTHNLAAGLNNVDPVISTDLFMSDGAPCR